MTCIFSFSYSKSATPIEFTMESVEDLKLLRLSDRTLDNYPLSK